MINNMNRVLLLFICIALSSCSSYFKRQTCESTNWFEYGQNVALEGRRLTGDQFVLECQKASSDIDEPAVADAWTSDRMGASTSQI